MTVSRTGDWALARRILAAGGTRLKSAIGTAVRQEAELLRNEIVRGITSQAPGGEAFKPLSPLTIASRKLAGFGGTKALIRRGDLRNGITTIVQGDEAFIGVPRKARGADGKSLVDVAKVQEFGSDPIVIPITPAMRRYLAVLFEKAGSPRRPGSGRGVVVVTIPPRPFLRPAFKAFRRGSRERFLRRVAKLLGFGGL